MRLRLALVLAAVVAPLITFDAAPAATVNVTVSNFRFCALPVCGPADQAYVSDAAGQNQAPGVVNPAAIISVRRGDTVRWTYQDQVCSALSGCFHQAIATNGAFFRNMSSSSPVATWTVPSNAPLNSVITYYCSVGSGFHARSGMTGALQIVA